jgi:Holliday junction DNA helicase RuvB
MSVSGETFSAEEQKNDYENALRPKLLSEFIGQDQLKENLNVFLESAKMRKSAMDHVLFYGPPGLGKTTLGQIIARELGVNFKMTSGPVLTKSGDLAAILTSLDYNDVLFIDEIHRLSSTVEEILYPAMEDFSCDLIIGEGSAARSLRIDLKPFTLVGSTTRLGLMTTPMRDRFGIPVRLNFYEVKDLIKVVTRSSLLMNIDLDDTSANEIARRSRGTPRIAGRLLRRVVDFATVENRGIVDRELVNSALSRLGVDELGLDEGDRKYLTLLANEYSGGPVGVDTLAAALSESRDSIEEVLEPFLLQEGMIQRTPRGRCLGKKGWTYLGLEEPQ